MATKTMDLRVAGMTCGGCAASVKRSVQALPGVLGVSVDLASKTLTADVDPARADAGALAEAVRRAGYEVVG